MVLHCMQIRVVTMVAEPKARDVRELYPLLLVSFDRLFIPAEAAFLTLEIHKCVDIDIFCGAAGMRQGACVESGSMT